MIPPNLRPFLMPAAWLATAALTFSIGRMTSYVEPLASSQEPAGAAGGAGTRGGLSGVFSSGDAASEMVKSPGSQSRSLEEITRGQPIKDWLKHLLSQEDEIVRMAGFMQLLEQLNTSGEIQQALEAVQHDLGFGPGSRTKEFTMLLQKWAQLDPTAAMTYVQDQKDNGAKYLGSRAVLNTWVRKSPQEAIAWAEKNGASQDDREGNWAMSMIVSQVAKNDVDWALRLAEAQGVSRSRGRTIDSLVPALVSQKGEEAARQVALNITDESLRDAVVGRLAGRLAEKDPKSAAAWVTSLPPGETRKRALTELVAQWSAKDPAAAATFLEGMPASPETDDSRARLAFNVLRKDPETAMAWAGSITDDKSRTEAVSNLVGSWMRRDADAAKQWVTTSQLPDDAKAKLLAAPPSRGFPDFGRGGPGGGRGGR